MKRQGIDWEKVSAKHTSDKELVYSEYIKNSYNIIRQPNYKIIKRFDRKTYKHKISI